jgi:WXG100 family type VII secretion target
MSSGPYETRAADRALTRAAGMVATAKVDFDQRAAALDDQIAGMAMRWQGAGGQAFQNLQRAWQEKQRTIMRALDDFERSLVVTDHDFTSTDDAQAHVAGTNLGRLEGVPTSL